jgi:hypothetical protein
LAPPAAAPQPAGKTTAAGACTGAGWKQALLNSHTVLCRVFYHN